jgi:hypothetical protein
MPAPVVSPVRLIRAAVMAQLSDPVIGLNPNLAIACAAYGVPVVEFAFAANGARNVFESYIDYGATEESGIPGLNLLCVYGASAVPFPAGGRQKLFNARWSGNVLIQIDQYFGVKGETVQDFEPWADAGEDAMIATLNNLDGQANFAGGGRLYGLEIASARGKCAPDGENWIVPTRFTAKFEAYIS